MLFCWVTTRIATICAALRKCEMDDFVMAPSSNGRVHMFGSGVCCAPGRALQAKGHTTMLMLQILSSCSTLGGVFLDCSVKCATLMPSQNAERYNVMHEFTRRFDGSGGWQRVSMRWAAMPWLLCGSQSLRSASRQTTINSIESFRVKWTLWWPQEGVDCVRVWPKNTEMQFASPWCWRHWSELDTQSMLCLFTSDWILLVLRRTLPDRDQTVSISMDRNTERLCWFLWNAQNLLKADWVTLMNAQNLATCITRAVWSSTTRGISFRVLALRDAFCGTKWSLSVAVWARASWRIQGGEPHVASVCKTWALLRVGHCGARVCARVCSY